MATTRTEPLMALMATARNVTAKGHGKAGPRIQPGQSFRLEVQVRTAGRSAIEMVAWKGPLGWSVGELFHIASCMHINYTVSHDETAEKYSNITLFTQHNFPPARSVTYSLAVKEVVGGVNRNSTYNFLCSTHDFLSQLTLPTFEVLHDGYRPHDATGGVEGPGGVAL